LAKLPTNSFFGIHGDHGLVPLLERLDPGIDLGKLGITIRVGFPFVSLARTLETIAEIFDSVTEILTRFATVAVITGRFLQGLQSRSARIPPA
jgi:hypothetical protein